MQQLIDYINQYVRLNEEAISELCKLAEQDLWNKNEFILEAGQRCNKIWFVKSGMVRKFHLFNGKEITTWIHCENEFFTSVSAYFHKSLSNEIIQTCEPTETICITRENSILLSKVPQIVTFTNILMGEQFAGIDQNTKEFNMMNAREKYKYLQKIAPEMIKRAKLGYIASIMGITQETLSRIRKRL
ncbi:MAG: Crp/Fnr family transcriptional regulator [Prolixibacteraceae bacterium]|nr:Crp/Fnr family transcriptional regulator [Prolixibacteraceae bacterium]MBN2772702.1 Crp/Fnr family transcriptional regulator [Prolixibacteraceae bacterium]